VILPALPQGFHLLKSDRAYRVSNNSVSISDGRSRPIWPVRDRSNLSVISFLQALENTSVAEPEPVEQQLFAGAGAEVFWDRLRSRYVDSYEMLQKP
jgi:hypothetical protein